MHTKYVNLKHRHASSFQAVTSAAPAVSVTGTDVGLCVNHQSIAVKRPTEETATSPRGSVAPEKSCWSSEEEDGSLFAAPMPTRMKQLGCSSQVWAFADHSERHRLKRMLKTDERALLRRVCKLTEKMEKPRPDIPVHTDSELGGDGPCDSNESLGDGNDGVASPEEVRLRSKHSSLTPFRFMVRSLTFVPTAVEPRLRQSAWRRVWRLKAGGGGGGGGEGAKAG